MNKSPFNNSKTEVHSVKIPKEILYNTIDVLGSISTEITKKIFLSINNSIDDFIRIKVTEDEEFYDVNISKIKDAIRYRTKKSVLCKEESESLKNAYTAKCPTCSKIMISDCHENFCGYCGQRVKWE